MKVLLIIAYVALGLFLLSLAVYFSNLDMKAAAGMQAFLRNHYDRIKRDRRL
jgi:hypothetical protein